VTAGFVLRWDVQLLDAFVLAGLLELLPLMAVAQLPLIRPGTVERIPAYVGSALTILGMGAVSLLVGLDGPGLAGMGLGTPDPGGLAVWTVLLVVAAGLLTGASLAVERLTGWGDGPLLRDLLPRTPRERRAFAGLSFCAGFGEEVAYRGFAIPALAPVVGGMAASAVFTSLAFGLLHAYQGPVGIARTAALGGVLAASFLLTGSLWPAIVAHVIIDLVGGLWVGPRLLPEEPSAAGGTESA
jgi:hypothetical protein